MKALIKILKEYQTTIFAMAFMLSLGMVYEYYLPLEYHDSEFVRSAVAGVILLVALLTAIKI